MKGIQKMMMSKDSNSLLIWKILQKEIKMKTMLMMMKKTMMMTTMKKDKEEKLKWKQKTITLAAFSKIKIKNNQAIHGISDLMMTVGNY